MDVTWGFIGCGHLSQSIITGALREALLTPKQIMATNRSAQKLRDFAHRTGIQTLTSNTELVSKADVIVLATKPQDIGPVLGEISSIVTSKKIVLSLAAGVSSKTLLTFVNGARTLARVMPNTPVTVQEGLFGIYFIQKTQQDTEMLTDFFQAMGEVVEAQSDAAINAITAGAASGTGFVLSFMEEFEKWFIKKGFEPGEARQITVETFRGTAVMAKLRNEQSLAALREAVTSKKGTTFAGLQAFKKAAVVAGLRSGLEAAYRRGVEISKSLLQNRK